MPVPGRRNPKASPRSCASSTQRHSCASRSSVPSPARLSQSNTCETTSVPAYCLVCRPCPRAYAFHATRRSESPARNGRNPAKSSSPTVLAWAPPVSVAVSGGASVRSDGRGQAIVLCCGWITAHARKKPSGCAVETTKRSSGTRPRALATTATSAVAVASPGTSTGTPRPPPTRSRRTSMAGRDMVEGLSSSQRKRTRSPTKPGSAASSRRRSPASVPWQWCIATSPRPTSRNVSASPRLLL